MISTDTPANVTPSLSTAHRQLGGKQARATVLWAASYLVVSGLVFAVTRHGEVATLHAALLILLAWAATGRGNAAQRVFDLAPPFVVIVLAYSEVGLLISASSIPFRDRVVQGWDAALFGMEPSHELASRVPYLALSEVLHAAYLSYYAVISIPALLLYFRGKRAGFHETMLTLVVTWVIGCALFVIMPVEGPRFAWPAPPGVPDGPFRRLTAHILAAGSVRGTAFPSLHMAASVSQAIMGWRWQAKPLSIAMSAISVLIGIGAVYAGYHYAADMIAGAALGLMTTACVVLILPYQRA
ncbi:MAG TPA: phosphatase PAP2 family protein [Gemmatimonadaceae bacterium]|jgi:membrane-associated phospholipid phosphatase